MSTEGKEKAGQGGVKRKRVKRLRLPGAPYTIDEVAAELSLAPRTVRKRIADGKLRAYHDGRAVRITEADLAEYKVTTRNLEAVPAAPANLLGRRHLKPAKVNPRRGRP